MKRYDYIITGAGASGLSLLVHLLRTKELKHKRILLVERTAKTQNDRTWCFWENGSGMFDNIVYRYWNSLEIFGKNNEHIVSNISPYRYKLIRGIDFYNFCFDLIRNYSNVELMSGEVSAVYNESDGAVVVVNDERYSAQYVFNSVRFQEPSIDSATYYLLQHFRGWFIKCSRDLFDEHTATLMDFRTQQTHGTSFFYIMPFSSREALIEYTLFSPSLLTGNEYDESLRSYCKEKLGLEPGNFEIMDVENGSIPMTNYAFKKSEGNIINIGTAGGNTKPSSGYTFRFIQKNSEAIVRALREGRCPAGSDAGLRHLFYDSVLLNILSRQKMEGADIFTTLFSRNTMQSVLKFLDSDTNLGEDLRLISTLPTVTFSLAAADHWIKQLKKKSSKP